MQKKEKKEPSTSERKVVKRCESGEGMVFSLPVLDGKCHLSLLTQNETS